MNRIQGLPERELVVLGGGHTHLHILRMWKMHPIPGVRLTCIANHPHATYSGMLPGTLAGNYNPEQMQIDLVRRCAAVGARLILAETTGLDRPHKQLLLSDRAPLPFDWLSIGIGSRPAPVEGMQHTLSIKPMPTFLDRLDQHLAGANLPPQRPLRLVVVGGGAGGVEIAFCLPTWIGRQFPTRPLELTLIHRGDRILTGGTRKGAELVQRLLTQRGHRVLLEHNVVSIREREVVVESPLGHHKTFQADVIIWAVGAVGPSLFDAFELAKDEKGFLLTNVHLQSIDDPSIFVVGDSGTCQPRPNPKAGVYAVRQGPLLWDNLRRSMRGRSLREWKPQADFLSLLNTGDDRAILEYKQQAAHGRWCWWLKDSIDRRFMKKHQEYQLAEMPSNESAQRITRRSLPLPHSAAARGEREEPVPPRGRIFGFRRGSQARDTPMRCDGCGGKLPASILHRVLERLANPTASHVRIGLDDAEDVAAVQLTDSSTVLATTDFFAVFLDDPYAVGRVAALNAMSDLFAKGARCKAALAHAIVPAGSPRQQEQLLYELLAGSLAEFRPVGTPIVGGHTIEGEKTVIGFTLFGEHPAPSAMRLKSNLRVGDYLLLTKPLGSGVLLAAHRQAECGGLDFAAMLDCMLVSNQPASEVADAFGLAAATDVTGFGLLGHLSEMLRASNVSATLDLTAVPLLPGAARLLESGWESSLAAANREAAVPLHSPPAAENATYQALFDPQTSGGLLLAVPKGKVADVVDRLYTRSRLAPAVIGRVTETDAKGPAVSLRSLR